MEEGSTACLYCLLRTFLVFWSPVKEGGHSSPNLASQSLAGTVETICQREGFVSSNLAPKGLPIPPEARTGRGAYNFSSLTVQGKSGFAEFSCDRGGHSFPGLAGHGDTILEVVAQLNLPGRPWEGQSWKSGHRTAMEVGAVAMDWHPRARLL